MVRVKNLCVIQYLYLLQVYVVLMVRVKNLCIIQYLYLLQVDMVLKLWKDGFSIDDGPIRDFNDADNQEFLDSIKKGYDSEKLLLLHRILPQDSS